MAKSREINMDLPSADDLFTTQEERDQKNQEYVENISIYEITVHTATFRGHQGRVLRPDRAILSGQS